MYMLRKKYTVKYLGKSSYYLRWKITGEGNVPIHAAQPKMKEKAVARAGLSDPRPSPPPKRSDFDSPTTVPPFSETEKLTYTSLIGYLL